MGRAAANEIAQNLGPERGAEPYKMKAQHEVAGLLKLFDPSHMGSQPAALMLTRTGDPEIDAYLDDDDDDDFGGEHLSIDDLDGLI